MGFGMVGGWGGGPSSVQANAEAGLPFASVPGDLQSKVEAVLADEPAHPEPDVRFSHRVEDTRPFTLRSFLAPHSVALVAALVLVAVESALLQVGPLLTQIGIDRGVVPGDTGVLVVAAGAYVASVAVGTLVTWARIAFTGRLGERLTEQLRIRVFAHLQRQSLDFYTREKAGVLMTRMTSDIEALSTLFQEGLVNFAVQAMTLLVITVYLCLLNPLLALITFLVVVPTTLASTLWFRGVSQRGYLAVRDRIAALLADLAENLAGVRVITASNRRRHNVARHTNIVGEHLDANLATARATAIYAPGTEALGVVAQGVLLLVGGGLVLDGRLTIGELAAFLLFLTSFFAPIQTLVQLYNQYQQGGAAVGKLRELLSTEPSVSEAPDAAELPQIRGAIELEGVTFSYGDDDHAVLHAVDLRIEPGEVLAVVGPTGAGKSTIAKLITRYYDPQAGVVRIDGHDLRGVGLRSLRRQLGVVPQEPFLFNGTIRDNVAFADPDADTERILEACHAVGLGDLLDRLPDGIDTRVHERGSSLSAGERQLLALARAFLARPRVLVLDEATSNLDLASERRIEQALDALLEGRTAVIIAHRLATAMRADRIAVVVDGHIAELGPHDELVAAGGHYAGLAETWLRHAAPSAG
jgi:ATP-binding cassette, subfamily B, bacterial